MYDIIILGSGPAGLTAGIYSVRAGLTTLVLAGEKWGGQLMTTSSVENFPGFPQGIQGPQLMTDMRKQAEKAGVKIIEEEAVKVSFQKKPFRVNSKTKEYSGKTIIIATGASHRKLDVQGEKEFSGHGVSYCATCDGPFFRGKKVAVVGGGDAALEEASTLSSFASEVVLIHRRNEFRASQIMQERIRKNPKMKIILNTVVEEILGREKVEGLRLKTARQRNWQMRVEGVFVAIGHQPETEIFRGQVEMDEEGYILISAKLNFRQMTSVEGVFAAGDCHDGRYKQAITAAGFGAMAALDAERWLREDRTKI